MVRVATLLRKYRNDIEAISPDGLSTEQQLDEIRVRANQMMADIEHCWSHTLRPLLADEQIRILDPADYTPAVKEYLRDYYRQNIHPVLTPLAFDPGHPFPFISNLSMNLAVVVEQSGHTRFARVKLPDVLPAFRAHSERRRGRDRRHVRAARRRGEAERLPALPGRRTSAARTSSGSSATPTW